MTEVLNSPSLHDDRKARVIGQIRRSLRPVRRVTGKVNLWVRWGSRYRRLRSNYDHAAHLRGAADWLTRAGRR